MPKKITGGEILEESVEEILRRYAAELEPGEFYMLQDICDEVGLELSNPFYKHAKRLGIYHLIVVPPSTQKRAAIGPLPEKDDAEKS